MACLYADITSHNTEQANREWRSFANPARTDGLKLSHWVKASTPADAGKRDANSHLEMYWFTNQYPFQIEYSFAKYNVHNPVLTYTQDEYNRYLSGRLLPALLWTCKLNQLLCIDESWTKEETDYLFELVREFDQRFYVIADRYDYPGGTPRSIDVRLLSMLPSSSFTN